MKMSVWSLACQQSVFQWYHSEKHLSKFYPQDGGESQLALKLGHCNPMYRRGFHCTACLCSKLFQNILCWGPDPTWSNPRKGLNEKPTFLMHDVPRWVIEPSWWLLLERGMLFRRLFVLRHRCCTSAATSRRHCFSHRTLHRSVQLCNCNS